MDYEGYDAIYLATEERKIRDAFEKAFPDKILENKRVYYDDIYDQDDSISYIKDVHFERKMIIIFLVWNIFLPLYYYRGVLHW